MGFVILLHSAIRQQVGVFEPWEQAFRIIVYRVDQHKIIILTLFPGL
jgi:hypothetical protein